MILALLLLTHALSCGTERWSVKTMTDPLASQVNLAPVQTTVEQLAALPAPPRLSPTTPRGARPEELTVAEVVGTVRLIRREADRDLHVVIAGDTGRTMIVELPSPPCARGSRVAAEIAAARDAISRGWWVGKKVRVRGVVFFDVLHGQTGVAPNGVELHPVLRWEVAQ